VPLGLFGALTRPLRGRVKGASTTRDVECGGKKKKKKN
jgi:hypothetical protein|tara:strand:- start:609 stop:722 length:114 start_codon:yes stop_codon:yes gene_type:complete